MVNRVLELLGKKSSFFIFRRGASMLTRGAIALPALPWRHPWISSTYIYLQWRAEGNLSGGCSNRQVPRFEQDLMITHSFSFNFHLILL